MPLTSAIVAYDERWPSLFAAEVERLRPVFGPRLVDLHHVGSTAVPELDAKPEIDLLAIVRRDADVSTWTEALARLGYTRGRDLAEDHHFFKRDIAGVRTHKLHVCPDSHPAASRMLTLRDHLRSDSADREAYSLLKRRLERRVDDIGTYLEAKRPFLDRIYERIRS